MAKGNYGVTSLGGSSGSGKGKEKYSRIQQTFAKGGYLPGTLEHGGGRSAKGVKPISDIANHAPSTGNDVFTSFRKK